MRCASVVVDIPTRALDTPYTYSIPDALADRAGVGCCVLVDFCHRMAVGYVVRVEECAEGPDGRLPGGLDPAKVMPIRDVLCEPSFDEAAGEAVGWIAREYAAPLCDAARLFCPPGFVAKVVRDPNSDMWALQQAHVAEVDDSWVFLAEDAGSYAPRANAVRERAVIDALADGPVRRAELVCMVPDASAVVGRLARKGVVVVERRRRVRGAAEAPRGGEGASGSGGKGAHGSASGRHENLTRGQLDGIAAIREAAGRGEGVVVLDGVTGSGKTEVYLDAIEEVLAAGRDACVLVPEISLTPQTVGRFRARFGEMVAVLHSRLSVGERFDQWDQVRAGTARVVVGARSALFAPLRNPGIYIIDEEHESSYKQSQSPRYHARDVAAELARLHGAVLVLGSATPSPESLARCEAGSWRGVPWRRVCMPERANGRPLPPVEVVDMAAEFSAGWRSMFSRPLTEALAQVVKDGQKAVLLLNQRGYARFLLCRDCGFVPRCDRCSTSLTYHERGQCLVCHTCGRTYPVPATCPSCGGRYLRQFGAGTQRVEDELRAMLPEGFPVVRMDADSTKGKGGHERCLEAFEEAPSAVLLGTQMIAKGLDYPQVTLVGVINADTVLKVCDFRAAERTYQLLEQVSGRAGRGQTPGRVIIQTYSASHPAIQAAALHDRARFYDAEMPMRREAGYPPYWRLANVLVWGEDPRAVAEGVARAAQALRERLDGCAGLAVVGPAECAVSRADGRYRHHVLVRSPLDADLGGWVGQALKGVSLARGVCLAVDIDPYDLM